MELVHDFTVPVAVDRAWDVLTDIERVVPCMPGASVTSVEGDAFEGGMKLKLGPIGMTFKGQGSFVEKDPAARTAVIEAKGRDARGNGGAQAVVTAALSEQDGVTAVHVVTDLNVTGKAAQFGTGVMKDVSNRLLGQFVNNLAAQLSAEDPTGDAPSPATSANGAAPAKAPAATDGSGHATNTPTARPAPTAAPAADGLDLSSLLFGSDSTKAALKTAATLIAGIAFGYVWGKNRILERQARRG